MWELVTEEEKRNQCSPGPLLNQTLLSLELDSKCFDNEVDFMGAMHAQRVT